MAISDVAGVLAVPPPPPRNVTPRVTPEIQAHRTWQEDSDEPGIYTSATSRQALAGKPSRTQYGPFRFGDAARSPGPGRARAPAGVPPARRERGRRRGRVRRRRRRGAAPPCRGLRGGGGARGSEAAASLASAVACVRALVERGDGLERTGGREPGNARRRRPRPPRAEPGGRRAAPRGGRRAGDGVGDGDGRGGGHDGRVASARRRPARQAAGQPVRPPSRALWSIPASGAAFVAAPALPPVAARRSHQASAISAMTPRPTSLSLLARNLAVIAKGGRRPFRRWRSAAPGRRCGGAQDTPLASPSWPLLFIRAAQALCHAAAPRRRGSDPAAAADDLYDAAAPDWRCGDVRARAHQHVSTSRRTSADSRLARNRRTRRPRRQRGDAIACRAREAVRRDSPSSAFHGAPACSRRRSDRAVRRRCAPARDDGARIALAAALRASRRAPVAARL